MVFVGVYSQVLVFNCDEEFDFRSMGRIFVGLLMCGAWGCFDEFNRLQEDVLSAVSQQVQAIQVRLLMLALCHASTALIESSSPVGQEESARFVASRSPQTSFQRPAHAL